MSVSQKSDGWTIPGTCSINQNYFSWVRHTEKALGAGSQLIVAQRTWG